MTKSQDGGAVFPLPLFPNFFALLNFLKFFLKKWRKTLEKYRKVVYNIRVLRQ